jgi:hypothetical protein
MTVPDQRVELAKVVLARMTPETRVLMDDEKIDIAMTAADIADATIERLRYLDQVREDAARAEAEAKLCNKPHPDGDRDAPCGLAKEHKGTCLTADGEEF